jgi:Zn-dependent peptidase ImmA (M78 family)
MTTRLRDRVELLADWILRQAGLRAEVPDLSEVAAALNAVVVDRVHRLPVEGRTVWDNDRPTIFLSPRIQSEARLRFTLAHEIAHVGLRRFSGDIEVGRFYRQIDGDGGRRLERFCDAIAGALLMPRLWMRRYISHEPSIALIFDVAHAARVSVSASAIRLRDLGPSFVLMDWRLDLDECWKLDTVVGARYDLTRQATLCHESIADLTALRRGEQCFRHIRLDIDGHFHELYAELRRSSDRCLMLVPKMPYRPHARLTEQTSWQAGDHKIWEGGTVRTGGTDRANLSSERWLATRSVERLTAVDGQVE